MNIFSIGQMAKLNSVSEKALRIYHREGLLIPQYVDERTGYRYYTLQQSATLDMILQMKELGLSLNAIKEIIYQKDMRVLRQTMEEHIQLIDQKINVLAQAKTIALKIVDQCHLCTNKPDSKKITIEEFPDRKILNFRIPTYCVTSEPDCASSALDAWERGLRNVKDQFLSRGLPLSLFRNVGCMITKENLLKRNIQFSDAFIFLDDESNVLPDAVIKGGKFVCTYCDGMTAPDGSYKEESILQRMLDYIDENTLTITGDYYGEVLAETPAFHYANREMYTKMQIPIA